MSKGPKLVMPHQRERNAIQCPSRTLKSGCYRFAVRIAYDGSDYQGFQSQISSSGNKTSVTATTCNTTTTANTVQDQIELRLSQLLKRNIRILGWGRTDAGVHANGAVFTVDLTSNEVRRLSGIGGVSKVNDNCNGTVNVSKVNDNCNGTVKTDMGMAAGNQENQVQVGISKKEERKRLKKLTKMKLKEEYRRQKKQMEQNEKQEYVQEEQNEIDMTKMNINEGENQHPRNDQEHVKEEDSGSMHEHAPRLSNECLLTTAKILFSTLRLFSNRPGSITAQSVTPIPAQYRLTFDPRFSCRWKRYAYYVSYGHGYGHGHRNKNDSFGCLNPFLARYAWQIDPELDFNSDDNTNTLHEDCKGNFERKGKLMQAMALINGKHNFEWLSAVERGEERDPIRTLELHVEEIPVGVGIGKCLHQSMSMGGLWSSSSCKMIKISATCDFFLYRMVRRIVGVLVAVGTGQVDISILEACLRFHDKKVNILSPSINDMIEEGTSTRTSTFTDDDVNDNGKSRFAIPNGLLCTAPANGLYLEHVEYDFDI